VGLLARFFMKTLRTVLLVVVLALVCGSCARMRFMPRYDYLEVQKDGNTAYIQKLIVIEF
jgi:hypothetical protein